ncbi:Oidioi.mRNA.OKI2018_I69.chr1.g2115.t2.cds [Oikopleura dioica]|uniref:Oidioi.mRNA.OKI2018_I69.chr1.g2115.t2.cds n=1 Tax=Oikopleura dioica TaxID=34765 RepID=A0ABN7SUB2_OIKDI|nr:Oidioi.mRNA.OKI2018_I69.chr1.g2115.t2.cds [Oikopleura dioica]
MKPGRKRDLEECSETPLFYTPSTLETTIPTVMTGECDSRRRKNGRGVTVKCSSCCMFLWIVLMIMIGFLIGSIINTVTSPDYQAGEDDPANAQLKMDIQDIEVRNCGISELRTIKQDDFLPTMASKVLTLVALSVGSILAVKAELDA